MTQSHLEEIVVPGVRRMRAFTPPQAPSGDEQLIKLDSNESLLGPGSQVKAVLQKIYVTVNQYPDASGAALKQRLARHLDVRENQITLGNGSNDVLDIIARTFAGPGDELVFSQYAFAVYSMVACAVGAKPIMVAADDWGHNLNAMLDAVTNKTKIIFIANPNNPTGTWLSPASLSDFLAKVPPRVVVVLDEAYIEYCTEGDVANGLAYLSQYPNLIITRTFSKAYGLAALRIGYSISSAQVADFLNRVRQPFNVNRVALAAAEAAIEDQKHLEQTVRLTAAGMEQWRQGLDENNISFIPSRGNFICVDVEDAVRVATQLAQQHVRVSPLNGYGMNGHIRITIGTRTENTRVIAILCACLRDNVIAAC